MKQGDIRRPPGLPQKGQNSSVQDPASYGIHSKSGIHSNTDPRCTLSSLQENPSFVDFDNRIGGGACQKKTENGNIRTFGKGGVCVCVCCDKTDINRTTVLVTTSLLVC